MLRLPLRRANTTALQCARGEILLRRAEKKNNNNKNKTAPARRRRVVNRYRFSRA